MNIYFKTKSIKQFLEANFYVPIVCSFNAIKTNHLDLLLHHYTHTHT